MTADRCLVAIGDFINMRGPAQHFYSDCGTNFVGAINKYDELLRAMSPHLAPQVATKFRIYWHFNPSRTPHWGGAWEILIRTLKNCLKAALKECPRLYTPVTFRSALLEIANRMNSRPLTEIPLDTEDEKPLTPNDFLFGDRNPSWAVGVFTDKDECSKSKYRRTQHLANKIWSRWVKEFTPMMALMKKWRGETDPVAVGEVVLLAYPNEPRETWRRAVITETHCISQDIQKAVKFA